MATRSRAVRWARFAGVLACALGAAILGASCRSVIGIEDGYKDSVEAICSIVDRCSDQGGCRERVQQRLDSAVPDPWEKWLKDFGAEQCLEGCGNARRCLDTYPVCGDTSCQQKEDCCGFISGRVDCDSERKVCCAPEGNKCVTDADCCKGNGPCSPLTLTCGGVFCTDVGLPCDNSFECCTNVCQDRKCAKEVCGEKGFECSAHAECCSGFCDLTTDSMIGRCAVPTCGIPGASCLSAVDCCDGPKGPQCVKIGEDPMNETVGVCSTCDTGLPNGVDCGEDIHCCSKFCNKKIYQCTDACADEGASCKVDTECCSNKCKGTVCAKACATTCTNNIDCCSNSCVGGQCTPECKPLTCAHNACSIGAPLSQACTSCTSSPSCTLESQCVVAVCAIDSYCCCGSWDSLCVLEAIKEPMCAMSCGG